MAIINTILFDLGGVILNLDQDRTIRAFKRMGADLNKINLESKIFLDFETGKIKSDQFRFEVMQKTQYPNQLNFFDEAWNAMLLDVSDDKWELIERLKTKYRICLLSNTNEIHIQSFYQSLEAKGDLQRWKDLFDEVFLSHETGFRKPDKVAYDFVKDKLGIESGNILFIDDSVANINGAKDAGFNTIWANPTLNLNLSAEIDSFFNELPAS